ncbi:MAG: hypothetical protein ACOZAN_03170 [Patescibacteria group bacterium]
MKFNPIISRISSGFKSASTGSRIKTTISSEVRQQQNQQLQSQLNQAVVERRKLAAAEFVNPDPLKSNFRQRGEILARKIADLQAKANAETKI